MAEGRGLLLSIYSLISVQCYTETSRNTCLCLESKILMWQLKQIINFILLLKPQDNVTQVSHRTNFAEQCEHELTIKAGQNV